MDDSAVQTAICVIGHPIAGNPSQFCTLRALAAMGIEWQCLSFDVPPESLPAAIAGINVLKFAGALIASPHHTTVPPLLSPSPDSPALPSPAPPCPDWIDGLARGKHSELIGCNFIGDAFARLLKAHEQKIGQQLRNCIYLGDADSFESLTVPYRHHLPFSCFVLGASELQAWPAANDEVQPSQVSQTLDTNTGSRAALEQPLASADAAADSQTLDSKVEADDSVAVETPDQRSLEAEEFWKEPLLLIRLRHFLVGDKKSASKAKPNPLRESLIASVLERLHPESLHMDLAPIGAPWPVLRGAGEPQSATITPLDLEIGRVATAIERWTGRDADRAVLAEAIEEYLEV